MILKVPQTCSIYDGSVLTHFLRKKKESRCWKCTENNTFGRADFFQIYYPMAPKTTAVKYDEPIHKSTPFCLGRNKVEKEEEGGEGGSWKGGGRWRGGEGGWLLEGENEKEKTS